MLGEITTAPQWLLKKVYRENRPIVEAVPSVTSGMFMEGRRNTDFAAMAGFMRRRGSSGADIEKALLSLNDGLENPLPLTEIRSVAYGAERYAPSTIESLTHKAFAELVAKEFGQTITYCGDGGGFYVYEDGKWQRDSEGLLIQSRALDLTDKLNAQISSMKQTLTEADYKRLKSAVHKTQMTPFIKASTQLIKGQQGILSNFGKFNADKNLLNLKNGVLDIKGRHIPLMGCDIQGMFKNTEFSVHRPRLNLFEPLFSIGRECGWG